MYQMLHVSSDNAADDLWFKYGASFYTSFFPRIGLTGAQYLPQAGVTGPYWGEMTCTAEDESRVINYVLNRLPAPLRDYLVYQLRHVAPVQHFGVWGAGAADQPGNKDGWSVEKPGWIIDSTGFAGPGERYTLAMMNSLEGEGGYRAGHRDGDAGGGDPVPRPPDRGAAGERDSLAAQVVVAWASPGQAGTRTRRSPPGRRMSRARPRSRRRPS